MAGIFTHIALVHSLCKDVDEIPNLTFPMKRALMGSTKFCELGSVSPDYPYLTFLNDNSEGWANVMHYWKTADLIRKSVSGIFDMDYRSLDALKSLAWIFGFTAHVVTDLTIHPVVNLKVGGYEDNKKNHRVCEMNQDVYIFHKMNMGDVTTAEYILNIASCGDPKDRKKLYPAISNHWSEILSDIPLESITMKSGVNNPEGPPDPNRWHRNFVSVVDNLADEGWVLLPIFRHFSEHAGLLYPAYKDLDLDYIDNLISPEGGKIHFDEVFMRAQENVKQIWSQLAQALDTRKPELLTLKNGDLDTGLADSELIFWVKK